MFGALRCNKDSLNDLEYVELSGNSGVNARNYTVLACDPCRERKVKCSGGLYDCQRCQVTLTTCTYRSSSTSTDPSNSKHRRSATDPKPSSEPSTRSRQIECNSDCRPAGEEVSINTQTDISQSLPSAHLKDGFWTPITLPLFTDWDDFHANDHEGLDLNLGESLSALPSLDQLPGLQEGRPWTAVSTADDNALNDFVMSPSLTANRTATSVDSSESRSHRCECIRALADFLERVGGDDGSDNDKADRFDDLLVNLRDGVETCKQVVPCNHCSVCTTNSMFVATIIQQLTTISQDLCHQLLAHQQKAKTASAVDAPLMLPNADIYVGKYQVRATTLTFEFIFTIVTMHLNDLQRLVGLLRNVIKTGTKACKLLRHATDILTRAFSDLQKIANGRLPADSLEPRKRKAAS